MAKNMTVPGCVEDVVMDAFAVFDKEKDGKVNASELKHVLTKMGEFLTSQEVDGLIKEIAEVDGDGNIKYADFVKSLNDHYQVFG